MGKRDTADLKVWGSISQWPIIINIKCHMKRCKRIETYILKLHNHHNSVHNCLHVVDSDVGEADLAGDLVVDGETHGCVKRFCYLGDTLDGDGGVNLAATARIRNGWMKYHDLWKLDQALVS